MTDFIFFTEEGYTFQPGSEAIEPDIENLQVLGFARGGGPEEAFRVMLRERPWLLDTTFEGTWCLALAEGREAMRWFSLARHKDRWRRIHEATGAHE